MFTSTLRPTLACRLLVSLSVAVLGLVTVAARAADLPAGVNDNAKLFGAEAVRQAEDLIRQTRQAQNRDVLVETYPTIEGIPRGPGKEKEQLRNDFLTDWMIERGQELGVRGMMIVVVMDPPHVQIYVGGTTTQLLPRADQEELQRKLAGALADKHYDSALTKTAAFIKDRMARHDPRNARPGPVSAVSPAAARAAA